MRIRTILALAFLLPVLAACSMSPVTEQRGAQFLQAGPPYPYNSFICP